MNHPGIIRQGTARVADAVAKAPPTRTRSREALAWSVAALSTLTAVALACALTARARVIAAPMVRFAFIPPDSITSADLASDATVISPDGRQLVFTGRAADGPRQLRVRALDSIDARALPDTEDALEPFWSPARRSVAFASRGKLMRVDLDGGRAQTLADAASRAQLAVSTEAVSVESSIVQ